MRDSESGGLTRRDTMAGAAALGLVAGRASAQEAAEATGLVFGIDAAGADRTPLPGVLVSNGREVVRTDDRGRYRLPMPGDGIVFVIKPPGYACRATPTTCRAIPTSTSRAARPRNWVCAIVGSRPPARFRPRSTSP